MDQIELTEEQVANIHRCETHAQRLELIKEYYPFVPDATQRFMAKNKDPWTSLGFFHDYQRTYRKKLLDNLEKKRRLVDQESRSLKRVESSIERSLKVINKRKRNIEELQKEKEELIPWLKDKMREVREVEIDDTPLTHLEQLKVMNEVYEMAAIVTGQVSIEESTDGLDERANDFLKNAISGSTKTKLDEDEDDLDKKLISLEDYGRELQE